MAKRMRSARDLVRAVSVCLVLTAVSAPLAKAQTKGFRIEEATIADIHNAIKSGQTTCRAVVQSYLDRARAFNGICTALVTADGAPIPTASGVVRAGVKTVFPTNTVPVTSLFPNYADYAGLPLELGRMQPTRSDPSVQQQVGMRVGIPNAGQLTASILSFFSFESWLALLFHIAPHGCVRLHHSRKR